MPNPVRESVVAAILETIAKVVNEWPREVRVPADLQRALAEAVFSAHAK